MVVALGSCGAVGGNGPSSDVAACVATATRAEATILSSSEGSSSMDWSASCTSAGTESTATRPRRPADSANCAQIKLSLRLSPRCTAAAPLHPRGAALSARCKWTFGPPAMAKVALPLPLPLPLPPPPPLPLPLPPPPLPPPPSFFPAGELPPCSSGHATSKYQPVRSPAPTLPVGFAVRASLPRATSFERSLSGCQTN